MDGAPEVLNINLVNEALAYLNDAIDSLTDTENSLDSVINCVGEDALRTNDNTLVDRVQNLKQNITLIKEGSQSLLNNISLKANEFFETEQQAYNDYINSLSEEKEGE